MNPFTMQGSEFWTAMETGDITTVDRFLDQNIDLSPFHVVQAWAVGRRHFRMIKMLIDQGADLNMMLVNAIHFRSLDIAEILIKAGADVNQHRGYLLRSAGNKNQYDAVQFLLKYKADVAEAKEAVFWASQYGNRPMVELLLKHGGSLSMLTPQDKEYFVQKRFYTKWRRGYLRRWIRRVLIPLYYSPENRGGIQAKKELETITSLPSVVQSSLPSITP